MFPAPLTCAMPCLPIMAACMIVHSIASDVKLQFASNRPLPVAPACAHGMVQSAAWRVANAVMQATAFEVFQLPRPSPEQPYIKGLLDPCTNSMTAPNIPAEVLYDKQVCASND